ncbi:MAG TPA: oxygenase MpaB family protein [Saprospiraceae bacterium]|nr:oxygenase MpaB family protein [Saprospiraceae bacterium]
MENNEVLALNFNAPLPPWEQTAAPAIRSRRRFAIRNYIATLDPLRDCQEISYLLTCYEFPWDTTRSLEFALFRVFGVAKGSPLLVLTGEFVQRTQKRYDDTVLILAEILENGYDSPRGHAALVRMNKQHGRFQIPNDEYLYTLSTFIFEPVRWNEKFGWRKLTENEKLAGYHFWCEIGRRMGIRDIPGSYEAYERFNLDFERAQFRYSPDNEAVAVATRNLMLSWVLPKWLWKLGAPFVHALIDDHLLSAVGMKPAPVWLQKMVRGSVWLRGRFIQMFPPRRKPRLLTRIKTPTYPVGYQIADLGASK